MFRELIPRLANDYRVIAPDLPGFGFTDVPAERNNPYSFDQLVPTINAFTRALSIGEEIARALGFGGWNAIKGAQFRENLLTS
jgi:pimeloyl-ACP methyl ester carboxylesterase